MTDPDPPSRPPSLIQVCTSVAAAFFGVQSSRNRRRDFSQGRALPFILVGLLMTAAFVVVLVLIVRSILPSVA